MPSYLISKIILKRFSIKICLFIMLFPCANWVVEAITIEEIIVTARKREESLQEIPISVTAFSGEDLEIRTMANLKDLGRFAPNLYFSNTAGASPDQAMIFMRGIGQLDFYVTTDPGVGLYVDGVYIGRAQGGIMDLLDLERIEVLRGPQGSLFGKNTIGGAVNIVSNAPTGGNEGNLSVSYGNNNRVEVGGTYDLALVQDKLFARGSILYKRRDCLTKRLNDNACYGDLDGVAARGYLRWLVSDNLTADVIIDYTDRNSHSVPHSLINVNPDPPTFVNLWNELTAAGIVSGPVIDRHVPSFTSDDPYVTEGNGPTDTFLDVFGASAKITWDISDALTLHSVTAYREVEASSAQNFDGTTALWAEVYSLSKGSQLSQELRLEGVSFNDRLQWIAGFYYFKEFGDMSETLELFPELALGNAVFNNQDTLSIAGFGHFSFDITDKLRLSGGIRYTDEEKDWKGSSLFDTDLPGQPTRLPVTKRSENWGVWSPKVALDYHLTDDILLFASASNGFRSGGFNGRAGPIVVAAGTVSFEPEDVWSYEIGVKSQIFGDRLRLNATGYYADYSDKQETIIRTFIDPVTGLATLSPIVSNAATAVLHGFELEAKAIVTEQLGIETSVGYINADFKEIEPGVQGLTEDSLYGYTPDWTVAIAGEYNLPMPRLNGDITLRTDFTYRSKVYFFPEPNLAMQKGFGQLNARLNYETNDGKWLVSLWGRNLTDKIYKLWAQDTSPDFGLAMAWWSDEREFGITVKRKF